VALEPGDKALYESDVAFVGTAYPERVLFLEKLADFKLALWGPGWDRLPRGHKLRPFVRGGSLRTEEWLKAFSAAKVSLNLIQSFGSSLRDDQVTMANSRCFELLGCGAFQLVDAKRDIRTLFKSGRELVWFSSAGEAAESMRHYLAHDEERRSVGTRAREAALASHTYRDRLTELLRACGK